MSEDETERRKKEKSNGGSSWALGDGCGRASEIRSIFWGGGSKLTNLLDKEAKGVTEEGRTGPSQQIRVTVC